MVANFQKSLAVGKQAEQFAEQYFKKRNLNYRNVTNLKEYQSKDIDYLVDGLGTVEVKMNFQDALYYHKGWYFWIETEISENQGWWKFCEADYFFFVGEKSIIIKNDDKFKRFVNNLIEAGDRSINRFDYKQDQRYNKIVTAKNLRVYLEQIENTDIEFTLLVKRRKIEN